MSYYIGNPEWLYYQLQQHYFDVHNTYQGIISKEDFIKKVEDKKFFTFTYRCYATSINHIADAVS
jgi:hypothetical protein